MLLAILTNSVSVAGHRSGAIPDAVQLTTEGADVKRFDSTIDAWGGLAVGSAASSKAPEGRQLIARGASPWEASRQTGKPRRGDRKRIWQDASRARDAARRIQSSVTPSELNDGEGPAIQGLAPLAIDCRPCGPDGGVAARMGRLLTSPGIYAWDHDFPPPFSSPLGDFLPFGLISRSTRGATSQLVPSETDRPPEGGLQRGGVVGGPRHKCLG